MPLKLYKDNLSCSSRAVMMACEIFDVPVEMIDVNLFENENYSPEFLKRNPTHTIPVLEDGDLYLHDSHAILAYLADIYGKNNSLYPKDVKKRALVNQKLFFNTAILFQRLRNISYGALLKGERVVPKKKRDDIEEAYSFLEEFLSRSQYLAGENLTIADLAAIATISSAVRILPLDETKHPKTLAWVSEIEKQPFYKKYNEPGVKKFGELLKNAIEFD